MVLINKEKGVLTAQDEFVKHPGLMIKRRTTQVKLGDVFRVHDYNYLMKVIDLCENKLKGTAN